MKSENYVAFFTISGFFVGLIFSFLKTQTILDFTVYTISITLFFYLFIHILLISFLAIESIDSDITIKQEYEDQINTQIDELKTKENRMQELIANIKNLKHAKEERI